MSIIYQPTTNTKPQTQHFQKYLRNCWVPFFNLVLKTVFLVIFAIAARGTMPRYRFDQLTQLNWKHFVFIWIGFLIFNCGFLIFFY